MKCSFRVHFRIDSFRYPIKNKIHAIHSMLLITGILRMLITASPLNEFCILYLQEQASDIWISGLTWE